MIDLIIPTYKNKQGLHNTLQSIPSETLSYFTITVIDDASNLSYADIIEDFSFINFIGLVKNCGPGMVRQYGIDHTCEPYIMFIDTGDYCRKEINNIFDIIKNNEIVDMFSWRFSCQDNISKEDNNMLHGKVYKREFLKKYNICFSELGSYGNEDIGFNQLCKLILSNYYPESNHSLLFDYPIIEYDTNDTTSITRDGFMAFTYKKQNLGLSYNAIHAYNVAKVAGVKKELINDYAASTMSAEYYYFIRTVEDRPEFAQDMWAGARYYYINFYKFLPQNDNLSSITYSRIIRKLQERGHKSIITFPINIYRFMNELEKSETVPEYYLTT